MRIARVLLFPLLLALQGCGLGTSSSHSVSVVTQCRSGALVRPDAIGAPPSTAKNIQIFQNTLFPVLTNAMNCQSCHGVNQSPTFALSSAASDFDTLLGGSPTLVNLDNPSGSLLYQYGSNGHCSDNTKCGPTNGQAVLQGIQSWASQQAASGDPASPGGGPAATPLPTCAPDESGATPSPTVAPTATPLPPLMKTQAMNLPSNLPVHSPVPSPVPANYSDTSFTKLTFSLDSLGDEYKGDVFSIEAQVFLPESGTAPNQVPTQYRFKKPRLSVAAGNPAVFISEVHLTMNGAEPTNFTSYLLVSTTVFETTSAGGPMLSPEYSEPILGGVNGQPNANGAPDQISFSFRIAPVSTTPACKNLTDFTSKVLGTAAATGTMMNACFSCHGSSAGSGYAAFNMGAPAATLCAMTLERAFVADPNNSAIIKDAQGWDGHVPATSVTAAQISAFKAWIQSEQ